MQLVWLQLSFFSLLCGAEANLRSKYGFSGVELIAGLVGDLILNVHDRLSEELVSLIRSDTIDMVLATDMSVCWV